MNANTTAEVMYRVDPTPQQILELGRDAPFLILNIILYFLVGCFSVAVLAGHRVPTKLCQKNNKQRTLHALLLLVCFFAYFRCASSAMRLVYKVLFYTRDMKHGESFSLKYSVPDGISYGMVIMGHPFYVTLFSVVTLLWLNVIDLAKIQTSKCVTIGTKVFLLVVNILSYAVCITAIFGFALNNELGRKASTILVYYVCAPVFALLLLTLNIAVLVMGIIIIVNIRNTMYSKKQEYQEKATKMARIKSKMQNRIIALDNAALALYKIAAAGGLFLFCINIQLVGVALMALLSDQEFISIAFFQGLPEIIILASIIFLFWPYPCCCGSNRKKHSIKELEIATPRARSADRDSVIIVAKDAVFQPIQADQLNFDEFTETDLATEMHPSTPVTEAPSVLIAAIAQEEKKQEEQPKEEASQAPPSPALGMPVEESGANETSSPEEAEVSP